MAEHPPLRSRAPVISNDRLVRVQTTCLLIIAGAITAAGLYLLQPVMIPLALALLVSYALTPLVELLGERLRLPRMVGVGVSVTLFAGALGGLGVLVSNSLSSTIETDDGDAYKQALIRFGRDMGLPMAENKLELDPAALEGSGIEAELWRYASELPLGRWASSLADGLLGMVATLSLVVVFAIFMMANESRPAFRSLRARVARRVKRYLAIKVLLSLVTGVLVGGTLAALGIDLALLIGILVFALNFIPNVGPLIATALPIPLLLFEGTNGITLILAIGIPGLIQFILGNIVEPRLLGNELRLHPVSVLAALVFWGMLWGVPGLLLAVPLTTAVHIAAGETELTRPIADLLSGRFLHPDEPEPPPTLPPHPAIKEPSGGAG